MARRREAVPQGAVPTCTPIHNLACTPGSNGAESVAAGWPVALALAGLTGLVPAAMAMAPREGVPLAVLAAPAPVLAVLARAPDARLLGLFLDGHGALVRSGRPGLAGRLYAAGATLVLAAPATGCASASPPQPGPMP